MTGVREKMARLLRLAPQAAANMGEGATRLADRFMGEGDYANRGGVAGMLGMPAWYEQAPEDIAMGFVGSVKPSRAVQPMVSEAHALESAVNWLRAGRQGRLPGRAKEQLDAALSDFQHFERRVPGDDELAEYISGTPFYQTITGVAP